ncbi:uncharacterized protein LOC123309848 [Coccinella septempunctata]|uniref:uncharacterized protein LOC123309848 n=1 Tax=Coccinella septempunctata TaxID=41139 RepID=UPI001D073DAB|nr:uncharacterized protein LOC123309848 [Coccinella septempunctata]
MAEEPPVEKENNDPVAQIDEKSSQALNSEFLYYSSVLKIIAPTLTSDADQDHVIPWIKKLFRPEYHTSTLREKRNRYLLYLTLTMFNDELIGVFETEPPAAVLRDLGSLPEYRVEAATWERDDTWRDVLVSLPENFTPLECSVHSNKDECKKDHALDRVLDQEFQFFLYLARPYAALMLNAEDRTKVACWLQTLCTIQGNCCSSMKAVRNDYMMALLGYISDLRAVGPFLEKPPWKTLPPLAQLAKESFDNSTVLDPTSTMANEFLQSQPVPEDGAFCYIALTGDLIESSFGGPGA